MNTPGNTLTPAAPTSEALLLATLYIEHAGSVRAFIRPYVPDRHRGEDIVQETFLRAWRKIKSIRLSDGNPRSYLFTTARNVLTDEWRAQSRRPALVADERRLAAAPSQDGVDELLETLTVGAALRRLSVDHRRVIQALYYDGLTVSEASERLGVAAGTVKSRAFYALRALRAAFDAGAVPPR